MMIFLILLYFFFVNGQDNFQDFQFLSGRVLIDTPQGVYGVKGVYNENNRPGGRSYGAAVFSPVTNSVIIWGGEGYDESLAGTRSFGCDYCDTLNELWEFNITTYQWRFKSGEKNSQTAVVNSAGFDPLNVPNALHAFFYFLNEDNTVLYVGCGRHESSVPIIGVAGSNYLWKYNLVDNEWARIFNADSNTDGVFNGRVFHADNRMPRLFSFSNSWAVKMSPRSVLIFGGSHSFGSGFSQSLFEFDTIFEQFRHVHGTLGDYTKRETLFNNEKMKYHSTNIPSSRRTHNSWSYKESFFIFSGYYRRALLNGPFFLQDTWEWNTTREEWRWICGQLWDGVDGEKDYFGYILNDGDYNFHELNNPTSRSASGIFQIQEYTFSLAGHFSEEGQGNNADLIDIWAFSNELRQWAYMGGSHDEDRKPDSSQNIYGSREAPQVLTFPPENVIFLGGSGYNEGSTTNELFLDDMYFYSGKICFHEYHRNEDDVCSGHGTCIGFNKCECQEGSSGEKCDIHKECFGHPYFVNEGCSNHGKCIVNETDTYCECVSHVWRGLNCSIKYVPHGPPNLDFLIYVGIGIGVLFVFLCIAIVVAIVISVYIVLSIIKQKKKLKKFDKIGGDVLLKEANAEQKTFQISQLKIDKRLFEVDMKSIKLINQLGAGGSGGKVYKADWKGKIIAYKVFKTNFFSSQKNYEEFEQEISIISSIKHPNIVKFYGASIQDPRIGILMEFCEKGSLTYYVGKNSGDLAMDEKILILSQITEGMSFLHSKNMIHRDLKSDNVLINANDEVKIIDFGLSKILKEEDSTGSKTKRIGTSYYMSPEVTLGKNYDNSCDVFSFAIIIWEVLHEDFQPYPGVLGSVELKVANNKNFRPKINEKKRFPKWLLDTMKRCWDDDPKKRESFLELSEVFKKNKEVFV